MKVWPSQLSHYHTASQSLGASMNWKHISLRKATDPSAHYCLMNPNSHLCLPVVFLRLT